MKNRKQAWKNAAILLVCLALTACSGQRAPAQTTVSGSLADTAAEPAGITYTETTAEPVRVTDTVITAEPVSGDSTVSTTDGKVTKTENGYTLTKGGTYTVKGALNGQLLVEAGEDETVVIELEGATITYSKDSPIKILSADNVEISAKKDTENIIKDERAAKTADSTDQGAGAIYAKCDLLMKGTGTLVVTAAYNNGIHTTKELTIQKLSLKVEARNNALKGNDGIDIKSGTVVAISTHGDGIESQNTDLSKSGNVRGDIVLSGGQVTVYAAGDGIQSAHNFEMRADKDGETAALVIYTGTYSGYTADDASTTSYKGIKVQNELNISAGTVDIKTYDDGLHADYGTKFDAGGTGAGTINISGGTITMTVYTPETKSGGGFGGFGVFGGGSRGGFSFAGPGGWGGQQTVSGADGIHADHALNISGGDITINSSFEGLEANVITISGGKTVVVANDDGVNATKGSSSPLITVSGGYLDVTVSPSGDTDGIDSNGAYTQTGGIVITRGPNNQMAGALDADGTVSISGGTLIILGYGSVRTSGSVSSVSLSLHSEGEHTVTVGGETITFTNVYSYSRTLCYSDTTVK